jgi:hypothetical protein
VAHQWWCHIIIMINIRIIGGNSSNMQQWRISGCVVLS